MALSSDSVISDMKGLAHYTIAIPASGARLAFLDLSQDADQKYWEMEFEASQYTDAIAHYYTISKERCEAIREATAELHQMFAAATAKVLEDDERLRNFQVRCTLASSHISSVRLALVAPLGPPARPMTRFDRLGESLYVGVSAFGAPTRPCAGARSAME